jgi:beta-lactamase class A
VSVAVGLALAGGGATAVEAPLDRQLGLVARIDRAVVAGRGGDPAAMQERYDAARALVESLRQAAFPPVCRRLAASLGELAASEVSATEAFDRSRAWRALEQRSRKARLSVDRDRSGCRPAGAVERPPAVRTLILPGPGEAFFGRVEGTAPPNAARALIRVNGARVGVAAITRGRFATSVAGRPGKALVEASFVDRTGSRVGAAVSRNAWLLPPSASVTPAPRRVGRALSARLATVGTAFDGYAAIHAENLADGTVAGWNDDALFPAASTVKLAAMIEAARRYGLTASSPVRYDVERVAAWSSNLAANRLLELIGSGDLTRGAAAAEARLRALGATSSTYPGAYRAGTSRAGAPRQPPLGTTRVTTARDLAAVVRRIHLAATGDARAARAAGMRASTARTLLRMLLASDPSGDNIGLVRPSVRIGTSIAQKNGWLSDARATAAIVYGPGGPIVLVVMGYRTGGLSLALAQRLGSDAARVALPPREG